MSMQPPLATDDLGSLSGRFYVTLRNVDGLNLLDKCPTCLDRPSSNRGSGHGAWPYCDLCRRNQHRKLRAIICTIAMGLVGYIAWAIFLRAAFGMESRTPSETVIGLLGLVIPALCFAAYWMWLKTRRLHTGATAFGYSVKILNGDMTFRTGELDLTIRIRNGRYAQEFVEANRKYVTAFSKR